MLKHTRVTNAPDMGRISAAVSRPGIDPRVWVSLAVVTAVKVDPKEGVFVDVMLLPSRVPETARVASIYAGPGSGFYLPIDVDDEVLVEAPDGNPDAGLVVTSRLWGEGSGAPPADAASNPTDLILLVKPDATLRLATLGHGNIVIHPRGDGKLKLGGESNLRDASGVGDDISVNMIDFTKAVNEIIDSHTPISPGVTSTQVGGSITSGSSNVEVTE
jgi:hypothetical protein